MGPLFGGLERAASTPPPRGEPPRLKEQRLAPIISTCRWGGANAQVLAGMPDKGGGERSTSFFYTGGENKHLINFM